MNHNFHLVPQQYTAMSPLDGTQMAQQLVQVLSMIAATQQEILTRLSAAQNTQLPPPPPQSVACNYKVTPFYELAGVRQQLDWLERNWQGFNLDGTQKQKLQITIRDLQEHQQLLEAFRRLHNL